MSVDDKITLSVDSLFVQYGSVIAVENISFSLKSNEILSIVGPSGSGKSTILHAIAGVLDNDDTRISGRIVLNGFDVSAEPPERRKIPLLFQALSLFPHMTVQDNISFPLNIRKDVNRETMTVSVKKIVDLVHLEPSLLKRYPQELSGGQQQRVALARALIGLLDDNSLRLLLLDEPLSSIDPRLRDELLWEICQLRVQLSLGILYITHNREEAMRVGDRIAIIDNGKLHQIATPKEIYEQPSSLFVANFFGMTNKFSAKIKHISEANISLQTSHLHNICAPSIKPSSFREGDDVYVVVNPSKISLNSAVSNTLCNIYEGMITSEIFLGEYWEVQVSASKEVITLRLGINSNLPKIGDQVSVSWEICDTILISRKEQKEG